MKREELDSCLNQTDDVIMQQVQGKLAKGYFRDVQQISSGLRRQGRHEIAKRVTEALYAQNLDTLNPYSLNWYFVAVVDEGNPDKIREADKAVAERVKVLQPSPEQMKHINSTRLKAANRIRDNGMFESAYADISDEDKTGNNYIVNQYFEYLNRNKRYQEIVAHYEALSPTVQKDKPISDRYRETLSKIGAIVRDSSIFLIGSSESAKVQLTEVILQSMIRVIKVTGDKSGIVSKIDEEKSGTHFAITCGTEFDDFVWGYLFGKMGVSNLVILTDDETEKSRLSDVFPGLNKPQFLPELPDPATWQTDLDAWKTGITKQMRDRGLNLK